MKPYSSKLFCTKNKLPVSIDFKKLSNDALERLFTDPKQLLNENLFIRSNNNTLILLNIDTLAINFQKKTFIFFRK